MGRHGTYHVPLGAIYGHSGLLVVRQVASLPSPFCVRKADPAMHRFLYRGREMSYSALLHDQVSARRETLYKNRGLDIDKWMDLVSEAKSIRREISGIAQDYDERRWKESEEEREEKERAESREPADGA